MIEADRHRGKAYLEELVHHHISGQLKIAPEHSDPGVLSLMGKPGTSSLIDFKKTFTALNKKHGKKQFLTYYFIAAHPGCGTQEMKSLHDFIKKHLKLRPEQVQIFTPTPSTLSTLMYYTGLNPVDRKEVFVEKDPRSKQKQKDMITRSPNQPR